MTTLPPDPAAPATDPVAARVDALRAALADDPAASVPRRPDDPPGRTTSGPPASAGPVPTAPTGSAAVTWDRTDGTPAADELADRLRRRRSAGHVAAAYSAAHGHPLDADHAPTGRRWALDPRTAVAAAGALLLVAVVVLGLALWPRDADELVDLAAHDGVAPAEEQHDVEQPGPGTSDVAAPSTAPSTVPPTPTATAATAVDQGGAPAGAAADGPTVVVHVVGRVVDPGLVTLPAGSRVADALDAAGGATKKADLTRLNLARTVVDGEQVHVPAPGETPPPVTVPAPGSDPVADAPATGDGAPGAPVPLNTADVATLDTLPGVGPVLAARIVEWRDTHGPFTSVDELTEVSGIGPSVLEGLRDLVVV